jgi:uncharacterized delta-60 repeat protein
MLKVLLPDLQGRILAGLKSYEPSRPALIRFNRDGSLDESFAPALSLASNSDMDVADIALQPDGKIVIAGSFSLAKGLNNHLARLNEDGTVDRTFNYQPDLVFTDSVRVDSDGTILAGGYEGLQRLAADGTRIKAVPAEIHRLLSSSRNGMVLASIAVSDIGVRLARILLDRTPRSEIVMSGRESFASFRPFDRNLEIEDPGDLNEVPISVLRFGDVTGPATVTLRALDGTAKAGTDYLPLNEILNFAPFEQEKTLVVQIPPVKEVDWSKDKSFELALTDATGADAVVSPVTVSIIEGEPRFTSAKPSGNGSVELTYYLPPNRFYILERSSDLITWSTFASEPAEALGQNNYRTTDHRAGDAPAGFYRLRKQ